MKLVVQQKTAFQKRNYNELYYCTVTELPRGMSLETAKHHVEGTTQSGRKLWSKKILEASLSLRKSAKDCWDYST